MVAMSRAKQRLPKLLNLGCGEDYRPRWHNVDVSTSVDPDETVDLDDYPWPWPSDHFTRVEARHLFEHLRDPLQAFQEIVRVLTPNGTLELTYPIGHTRFEDPTHRQFWNWHTAAVFAGDREHSHEVDIPLELVDREASWDISQDEPLIKWYTQYRLWRCGPGPWLEQIPGIYGEITVKYIHTT